MMLEEKEGGGRASELLIPSSRLELRPSSLSLLLSLAHEHQVSIPPPLLN